MGAGEYSARPAEPGVDDEARPLGVQLWDREEAPLEEAARRLVDLGITVIDLNFGCPKKRIMGTHAAGATCSAIPRPSDGSSPRRAAVPARVPGDREDPPRPDRATRAPRRRWRGPPPANGAAAITVHGQHRPATATACRAIAR